MNLGKRHIFFFAHLIHLISSWEYKDVGLWENEYPSCGGAQQSPINLDDIEQSDNSGGTITFKRYNITPKKMTIKNNGHTVEIKPEWNGSSKQKPRVIKDGTEYEVVQLHYHWGSSDDSGSEHVFNKVRTSLEVHVVHWNPDYGSFDPEQGDGILVIGNLYITDDKYSAEYLNGVISSFPNINEPDSEPVEIEPFSLSKILTESWADAYLTYTGSLTTPPCSEGVSWVILNNPSTVDSRQMEAFRTIKFSHGDDHNNRPLQSPNSRQITRVSRFQSKLMIYFVSFTLMMENWMHLSVIKNFCKILLSHTFCSYCNTVIIDYLHFIDEFQNIYYYIT
ncbi:carbonic anhydrase 2-like [Cotesia glomerata]|uniref:carbonic anhydrase 2-like n=1 Tax=Cotesia glomerata TaxID=32391 RepID=UPI001D021284|nr:carbonic anhydrase 2-like [Cotesia glomerata]